VRAFWRARPAGRAVDAAEARMRGTSRDLTRVCHRVDEESLTCRRTNPLRLLFGPSARCQTWSWAWYRRKFAEQTSDVETELMEETRQSEGLSLTAVVAVLRQRGPVIVLCALLGAGSALGISLVQEKQYTASASLLFRDPALDQKLFGSTFLEPSQDPAREAATNVELVSLEAVAARTARVLDARLSPGEIASKVRVAAKGQSDVVSVKATDPSPGFAARLANAFAEQYIAFRREADREKINEAQELVQNQLANLAPAEGGGARARSLSERAEELQILASLQTGNAELVERARVPGSPTSPKTFSNTVIGGIFGLLVGVGLAFLFERLSRHIKDPKELENLFERPILGAVPESRAFATAGHDPRDLPAVEAEAFRMLRANLRYFNVDRNVSSVLITSGAPGDGKTTVAWHLASAAAETGTSTLLLEADLRHPSLGLRLGLADSRGLSQVLAGNPRSLQSVVNQVPVSGFRDGGRTLDVVLAGALPPNSTDLMESERMREILKEAEREYELVVIDTPPTSVVSDAIPLVTQVSGVIVVSRLEKTTREAASHLHSQLEHLDAPVLGVVMNSLDVKRGAYGYGYGYGEGREGAAASDGSRQGRRNRATGRRARTR
jgi:tyrosine-protein kinase